MSLETHHLPLVAVAETPSSNRQQPGDLLAALPGLIFLVDEGGIYQEMIPAKPFVGNLPASVYVGRSIASTMPASLARQMLECVSQVVRQGEPQLLEFQLQQPEGPAVYEARFVARGNREVLAIIRDVSGRLAAEEQLRKLSRVESALLQRNRELILLNRASQALSSTLDFDQVLEIMLEEVRRLLNVVACSVWLIDRDTTELVCRQVTDPLGEIVRGWRLEPGQGLAGWVATRGESIIVPDAWSDKRHFKGIDEQTGLPLRSILTVPLRTKQEVIGVLQVVDQTINRFDDNDLRLMESLAAVAANAIENAHLFTELTKTQAQLIERERLAALGQMSATIAHELRNPLMAIRMGVEYLLRNVAEDDPRQRGARLMHANIDRIDRIVEDILFVARAPQPKLIPALLPPIIEAEVARWELTLAEKKISLQLDLDMAAPSILLDTHQMARALSNLIGNSVDILSPGGEIRLQLYSREDSRVTISLSDNGPGISPEHLPRVFDPFFTTKTRGTGLGLSIVKQIVRYHQGVIEVWSDMEIGTRFTISLPTIESDRIPASSRARPA